MSRKAIPSDALLDLRRRLAPFPPRSAERRQIMQDTATLYGVSETTLYRALRERAAHGSCTVPTRGLLGWCPPTRCSAIVRSLRRSSSAPPTNRAPSVDG